MASARNCVGLWEMWMPVGSKSRRRAPLPGLPGSWRGWGSGAHSSGLCALVKLRAGELRGLDWGCAIRGLRTWEACGLESFAVDASEAVPSRFERFFSRMMFRRSFSVSFRFAMQLLVIGSAVLHSGVRSNFDVAYVAELS
jgi:hypothetical protein